MKNYIVLIPFLAAFSLSAMAQETEPTTSATEVENATMDVMKQKRGHGRGSRAIKKLVAEYMLENGDITVEELEVMREERRATKAELRELREAGDEEALEARLEELRMEREAHREELNTYITAHEDLAAAIEEKREEIKARRQERRQEKALLGES